MWIVIGKNIIIEIMHEFSDGDERKALWESLMNLNKKYTWLDHLVIERIGGDQVSYAKIQNFWLV